MSVIKRWAKKYSYSIMCYACASLAELGAAGALVTTALDHSHSVSLPVGALYLAAVGVPLGLLGRMLARETRVKYQHLVEEIDLHGFTEPLLIRCEESQSTKDLVEVIAEEKDLAQQYSESLRKRTLSRHSIVSS